MESLNYAFKQQKINEIHDFFNEKKPVVILSKCVLQQTYIEKSLKTLRTLEPLAVPNQLG